MSLSEFDIITRYFRRSPAGSGVELGVGDDAALVSPSPGRSLVLAMDTLVEGRHFPADTRPADIGHKALAVNLSDLAAMGAEPAWALLALTLPSVDEDWLRGFSEGFFALAGRFGVTLVGGDTTRGPLTVTVQVLGQVAAGRALRRDAARPGQHLFVTGTPGDAALALEGVLAGGSVASALRERLDRPEPRVVFGQRLAGLACAAIDVSDGLLADLGHLLEASGCGARVDVDAIPRSRWLRTIDDSRALAFQLGGGDDYELCFSVDADQVDAVHEAARDCGLAIAEIGIVEPQPGVRCVRADGSPFEAVVPGFDHFGDRHG